MKSLQERITFPVIIGFVFVILIALIWFLFFNGNPSSKDFSSNADTEFTLQRSESGEWILNQAVVDTSRRIFDENGNWLSFDELLQYASTGEVNLVSELWGLRRQCPENVAYEQCNEIIRAFIADHYSGKDAEYLMKLFSGYLKYETTMREFEFSDKLSRSEKYELVKKKRREFFSDQDAKLIFGMEESEETYRDSLGGFLKNTESLNGDQRMLKYEEFRKNVYGQYYNTIKTREPKFNTYETELFIRDKELEKMNLSDRNGKTRIIREKYFGKDGADRMDTVYKEIEAREKQEKQTQNEETDWIQKNSNVKGEAREKALMEIRIKNMGKEEAEEYSRRLKYEEELKKNQN
ncbi:lipase secretion chaperone [Leptospira sp. WS92.C1]